MAWGEKGENAAPLPSLLFEAREGLEGGPHQPKQRKACRRMPSSCSSGSVRGRREGSWSPCTLTLRMGPASCWGGESRHLQPPRSVADVPPPHQSSLKLHLLQPLMESATGRLKLSMERSYHQVVSFLGFHVLWAGTSLSPRLFSVTPCPPRVLEGMGGLDSEPKLFSLKSGYGEGLKNRSVTASSSLGYYI